MKKILSRVLGIALLILPALAHAEPPYMYYSTPTAHPCTDKQPCAPLTDQVHRQVITGTIVTNPSGTPGPVNITQFASTPVSSAMGIPVGAAQAAIASGTITTSSSAITSSVSGYSNVTVTVSGTYAGVNFGFFGSVDGGVTYPYILQGTRSDSQTAETTTGVLTANTTRMWNVPAIGITHLKILASAYTSGTANITLTATADSIAQNVVVGGTVSATQSGSWSQSLTPGTTGGWTKQPYPAQSTTVRTVKGTAGEFGGYIIYNSNASAACIQLFDVASATSVTLGTTVPDYIIPLPALAAANVEIANGVNFALGIKLAVATTCSGSSAVGVGLDMTVLYK